MTYGLLFYFIKIIILFIGNNLLFFCFNNFYFNIIKNGANYSHHSLFFIYVVLDSDY
ncbi:hypothetical protein AcetOrient_orf02878 [Acetobacter orientalis]|uniref:Uncharacterized protein n=1 Tax=Acetobacter orientalis TaxID=146474 RepID=A0A2Z5ZIE4_9PROT|nr:hypothetical protein AcetOrient_orf02878 [Acetobacter orientalis]